MFRAFKHLIVRGLGPAFFVWASAIVPCQADNSQVSQSLITDSRQQALVSLVRNDCGSCHGLTLKGGLGSPLLPETLADSPNISLRETILKGRPGTAMPGWSAFMNEAEAEWIVTQLKKGFPNAK